MNKAYLLFGVMVLMVLAISGASTGLAANTAITAETAELVGAGATFPAPLYQRWIREFAQVSGGFPIFYDAVGSGEGIDRFISGNVDFGASDAAMTDAQMQRVERGVKLIPATAGIIVMAYNLPGVESLHLSREVYSDIFLGNIRTWQDARIQALNPGVQLPDLNIATITRSDSSGTTWAFTNHLNAISETWRTTARGSGKKSTGRPMPCRAATTKALPPGSKFPKAASATSNTVSPNARDCPWPAWKTGWDST
ncbi:phosphate ABC transporter substrate-binding protein PstS [Desulfosarcina cetonica]|uniref:phosphate ABC transporter substrate-binding protein PstS n=1 Tax=Desulfosarcina cetonica TaxID=90730 RepID=UPI000AB60AF8|nr:phosphate ABC transporter substrate-binding protein PstS [Desulfosarcina cetonica]